MSVIVTGMDMPEKCAECDFCYGHICKRTGVDIVTNVKKNYPLKSVDNMFTELSKCIIPKRYVLMKDEQYNLGVRAAREVIKEYCGMEDEKCR